MATTTAPKQKSETAEQILDLAETLIQTRGYSAFSYQDIADSLGIRKASIHYHFPSISSSASRCCAVSLALTFSRNRHETSAAGLW